MAMNNWILCRDLRITIVSATNVEQVEKGSKIEFYAKATIGDKSDNTKTDGINETNPQWNQTIDQFTIPACYVEYANYPLDLTIEICLSRILRQNQRVGYASQNLNRLFLDGHNNMMHGYGTMITLPLVNNDGVRKGEVTLTYFFDQQRYIETLCLAKKMVNVGASIAVNVAVISAFGLHVPTPIHVYQQAEIVNGGSSSNRVSLLGFIAEGVKNMIG